MGLIDKAAKKVEKKVLGKVEDFAEDLIEDALDVVGDVKELAEKGFKEASRANNRVTWYAEKGIPRIVGREIPKLGEKLLEEFKGRITDEMLEGMADALDDAADTIETLAPSNFTLIFGAEVALVIQCEITVSVTIPNPVARLTEIRKWADDAPKGRAEIIECIKDFGPESLSIEAKVSGNGMAASWDGEEKYDRIDAFLEKHGVK